MRHDKIEEDVIRATSALQEAAQRPITREGLGELLRLTAEVTSALGEAAKLSSPRLQTVE